MSGVSLAARVRLFAGLALVGAMVIWDVLAVEDARECAEPGSHDPNLFVSLWLLGPVLWLVALVVLVWGRERPWGWVRAAALLVAAAGYGYMFTQATGCIV